MSQSKKHSILESSVNVISGLIISFMIQLFIFPFLGIPMTLGQNITLTLIFSFASLIRGYVLRRIFNKLKTK